MQKNNKNFENWGSQFGVILAVAGSAIGLGNFLRFPGQVANNGGGAFMIPYIVSIFIIAIPLSMSEWALGRFGGRNGYHSPVGAYYCAGGRKPLWGALGCLTTYTPFVIAMYYLVIEAWCLVYALQYLGGVLEHFGLGFSLFDNCAPGLSFDSAKGYQDFFCQTTGIEENGALIRSRLSPAFLAALACAGVNFLILYAGVSKGIERFCKAVAPLIALCALAVIVRVMTLDGPDKETGKTFLDGLAFMWEPTRDILDENGAVVGRTSLWTTLADPNVWLAATSQIFFSISISMGAICTYASYVRSKGDVALSSLAALSMNEFFEVCLGGLMTIPPAIMFLGAAASQSVGSSFALGFNALPNVFGLMPMGQLWGFLFFFLLLLAAITSSISMTQPTVSFMQDAFRWNRRVSVAVAAAVNLAGTMIVCWFTKELAALDVFDFWAANLGPFFCGVLQAILIVFIWGERPLRAELERGSRIPVPLVVTKALKFVTLPYLILVVIFWAIKNIGARVDEIQNSAQTQFFLAFLLGIFCVFLGSAILFMKRWRERLDNKNISEKETRDDLS